MVKFSVEMKKRDFVWIGLVVVLLSVGFGIAFGGNQPDVMGHSAGELEVNVDGVTMTLQNAITNNLIGNGSGGGGGMSWGDACDFQTQSGSGTLSCAADEYLVETFVNDEGGSAEYSVNYGYGGSLVSTDSGGASSGILCCENGVGSGGGGCVYVESTSGNAGYYEVSLLKNGRNICELPHGCDFRFFKKNPTNDNIDDFDNDIDGDYAQDSSGDYREELGGGSDGRNGDGTNTKIRDFGQCDLYDDYTPSFSASKDTFVLRDTTSDNVQCALSICARG